MRTAEYRRGGVIGCILLTFAAIGCAALLLAIYVARNVSIEAVRGIHGGNVAIETPAGSLTVRSHEHAGSELAGVPGYPGARKRSGGAVVEWASNGSDDEKGMTVFASEMITPDPAWKVVQYYRTQLPGWVVIEQRNGTTRVELSSRGHKQIVAIKERFDGTHIAVASVGEPAAN